MKIAAMMAMVVALTGTAAWAADPDEVIIYRKSLMSAVGAHTHSLGQISQGKLPYDQAFLTHARLLADTAALTVQAFKENTAGKGKEKTTMKPEAWAEWAKFEAGLKAMEARAQDIVKVASNGGAAAAGPALGELFKTCKGCHDAYRTK